MKRRLPLSIQVLIGLGLGVLAGLALQGAPGFAADYIQPVGTLFLNLVKMLVVPLVFSSIVTGTCGLGDARQAAGIGARTILFYLCTTAVAVTLGLLAGNLFPVGRGLGYALPDAPAEEETIRLPTPCSTWCPPTRSPRWPRAICSDHLFCRGAWGRYPRAGRHRRAALRRL